MPFLDHFGRGRRADHDTAPPERGRTMTGTGRGGAGNVRRPLTQIRYASQSADTEEVAPQQIPSIMHVGRGGMGNVRSPSRDPAERRRNDEESLGIDERQTAELRHNLHTTGRGGRGNLPMPHEEERGRRMAPGSARVSSVLRSISRSRSREPSEPRRRDSSTARRPNLDQLQEAE